MKKTTPFSKRFAALGTALTDKYRGNPYVRSTVNIILLQVLLTILIVIAFGVALHYVQQGTVAAISRSISTAITTGATTTPDLAGGLRDARDEILEWALLGLVLLTSFFGYLAARFALKPTQNSLEFQKRFIGNMAHEVRTPLASIKTNTEVALMDPMLPPGVRDTFTSTLEEVDRISGTINNLLSFNMLVRPSNIVFATVNMNELAETVVAAHEALAASRGIELSYHADGEHLIWANATGINQVLTNLVKNALNYTPKNEDGSVSVILDGDEEEIRISVADTGIGIGRADLYHIFQPFYRADTSRARSVGSSGSSGLGLAIVNEIVRMHGGKINVRSALNRGTTVEVRLPKRPEDGSGPEAAENDSGESVLEV